MELHQLSDLKNGQHNKRGPYRSVAKGMLPKRRTEEAVQKLAEKNAKKGRELEIANKALKRKEKEIKELEYLLELANRRVAFLSDQEGDLLDARDKALDTTEALQTKTEILEKELKVYQVCFKAAANEALVTIKKKPLWPL